jgi:hypothetical protein
MIIVTGVDSSQISGRTKDASQKAKKEIEKELGIDFLGDDTF